MFYTLNENVYLVEGNSRSCIYDFNTSKLYSINRALAEKLNLVNTGKLEIGDVSGETKKIFDNLIDLKILALSENHISHYIDEIRGQDRQCDFAWIEITNRCNLRCIHCYNESNPLADTVMSLQNYRRVIDCILKLKVKRIQIIGGEPFFDKHILKQMLDYTIGKFAFIEIFTNGTLISSEWFEYLKKNDIRIALSVYSYDQNEHDKVTKCKGSWEKTNATIEGLRNYGIQYRVCNVLMKDVVIGGKTTDLYQLSNEKDVVRMSGRANFSLLSDELIRKKLITKQTFQTPINKNFCRRLLSGHNCYKEKIYVSANMEVFPCVMERRLRHCTINQDNGITLDESIRNLNKDKIEGCKCCEYRYVCFDCRPNSLSGNLYEKPWYCTYNPILGKWEDENKFIRLIKEKWG